MNNLMNEIKKNPVWLIAIVVIVGLLLFNFVYIGGQKAKYDETKNDFIKKSLKNYFCQTHQELVLYEPGPCPECGVNVKLVDPLSEHVSPLTYFCPLHTEKKYDTASSCEVCGIALLPDEPTDLNNKSVSLYIETLKKQQAEIVGKYRSGDSYLEAWFPKIKVETTGFPEKTVFQLTLKDQLAGFRDRFIRNEVRLESSLISRDAGSVFPEYDAGVFFNNDNIRTIQKQFNMLSKVVNSMFVPTADGRERPLVTQFEKLVFDSNVGGGKGSYKEFTKLYWEGAGLNYPLPSRSSFTYGDTIIFAFAVKLPYESVPSVVANLMATDGSGIPYVHITGIKVRKLESLPESRKFTISEEDFKNGSFQPSELFTPAPVMLTIIAEVYDFNLDQPAHK